VKKLLPLFTSAILCFSALLAFASCSGQVAYEATTTIGAPQVKATAYSGVHVLTWKAVKDAGYYTVYKMISDGTVEERVSVSSNTYYYDASDFEAGKSYVYRVVANPADTTAHNASEKSVTVNALKPAEDEEIKGTLAPAGTDFSKLAKYEKDYKEEDAVLSSSAITVKRVNNDKQIRVTFPVKSYAKYEVYMGQKNGFATGNSDYYESSSYILGLNYNKYATVDLDAVYTGLKEITVKAIPLSPDYNPVTFKAADDIKIVDYNDVSSAATNIEVIWTKYDSNTKKAKARLSFTPATFNGSVFGTSDYTIYRGKVDGNTVVIGNEVLFSNLEVLGSPKIDVVASTVDKTVYYYDDNVSADVESDVTGYVYVIVLSKDGKLKSESAVLSISDLENSSWEETNWEVDQKWLSGNLYFVLDLDLSYTTGYVNQSGKLNIVNMSQNYDTYKLTYAKFDTINQAKAAVKSELSNTLAFDDYNKTSISLDTASICYYAFRLETTKGSDKEVKTGILYRGWENGEYTIRTLPGFEFDGIEYVYTPQITVECDTDELRTEYVSQDISWDHAGNAYYYQIFRKLGTEEEYKPIAVTTNEYYTDASYEVKIPTSNVISYYVVPISRYGTIGEMSNIAFDAVIGNPNVNVGDSNIYWEPCANAAYYEIYRSTSDSMGYGDYVGSTSNTYYYVDRYSYDTYYYVVAANDNIDRMRWGKSDTVKVGKLQAPSISIINNSILTWEPVPGATSYYVLVFASEEDLASGNASDSSYVYDRYYSIYSWMSGYYFAVVARNSNTESISELSNVVKVE